MLVDDFVASRRDHEFSRWAISVPGERAPLLTDVFDANATILYEAKAASGRNEARMAVGQLLDYRRHIPIDDLKCALLLPERPRADLRDFISAAGLGVAFRDGDGFAEILSR